MRWDVGTGERKDLWEEERWDEMMEEERERRQHLWEEPAEDTRDYVKACFATQNSEYKRSKPMLFKPNTISLTFPFTSSFTDRSAKSTKR